MCRTPELLLMVDCPSTPNSNIDAITTGNSGGCNAQGRVYRSFRIQVYFLLLKSSKLIRICDP